VKRRHCVEQAVFERARQRPWREENFCDGLDPVAKCFANQSSTLCRKGVKELHSIIDEVKRSEGIGSNSSQKEDSAHAAMPRVFTHAHIAKEEMKQQHSSVIYIYD